MTKIKQQFLKLVDNLEVEQNVADPLFASLINYYHQPHRFYHNLSHIQALLQHFEQVEPCLHDPLVVQLAIFYHDIIYDPTSSHNELNSAEMMQQQLAGAVSQPVLAQATRLIIMTQKHQLDESLTPAQRHDASYFLDMDLAILGADRPLYQAYVQAIRQEYAHVCDKDYAQGRLKVLTNFLQRPRLFFSDNFFERFEMTARDNLNWEILQLSGSSHKL